MSAAIPALSDFLDLQQLSSEQFWGLLRLARELKVCLLYTSDAADERSSVDLGGRRIIKKKNQVRLWCEGVMKY